MAEEVDGSFNSSSKPSEKPTAKELSIYIKPYAQQWYDIGILLNISVKKLEEIEEHHKNDVQSCSVRMLMEWIVSDPSACWKKLWDVVGSVPKNTNIKPSTDLGQEKPQVKELHKKIVPLWAAKWKELGEELGLSHNELETISLNHAYHPRRCEECCKAVLRKWLDQDLTASWNKIDEATNNISGTTLYTGKGNKPAPVTDHVKVIYEETRYKTSKHDWPPEQPEHFTSVTIIYHRKSRNKREILAVAGVKKSGKIMDDASQHFSNANQESSREYLAQSKLTKNISEIFEPSEDTNMKPPRSVLIEGAPGIGKTILSKEIAYKWAMGDEKILQDKKLVLLMFMRDPVVTQIKSIENLVHSFYNNDPGAKDEVVTCSKHLLATEGSELAIILDGYDELSEELRNVSLFSDIIGRRVLPKCVLVITSRPSASAHLHNNVERRMEILGFSESDRKEYIRYALKGMQDQIQALLEFLVSHPTIDSLCYIPLNMTILLYLMKHRDLSTLPTSQTNLYRDFICSTICHHLKKLEITFKDISDLNSFPRPYHTVINKLAKLSYTALDKSRLVFTSAEIIEACPEIDTVPGALNCFGLLQAVEHHSTMQTTLSFNFVHFSIQEYLAAFYISLLEDDKELKVLQDAFWTGSHHNTWVIYTGITKGQKAAFKNFLCGGKPDRSMISPEFLETARKCIHLFECFDEAEDYEMCHRIDQAEVFKGRINTSMRTLTPWELKSLCVFLTKTSIKIWDELSLSSCIIGDTGCSMLEMALSKNARPPTIESMRLEDNQLTALSTEKIIKIATYCNTQLLDLRWNELQDGEWIGLAENTSLISIVLDECNLQAVGTKNLVAAVKKNKSLTGLRLDKNGITDEAAEALAAMLAEHTSLNTLRLCGNPLTEKGTTTIMKSLYFNRILEWLWLPSHFSDSKVDELHKQEDEINSYRLDNKCYAKLTVLFFDK